MTDPAVPTTHAQAPPVPWHALPPEAVAEQLATSASSGLTSEEAARRLREGGPNALEAEAGTSIGQLVMEQVANPMVYLLAGAAVVSLFAKDVFDAVVIALIVVANVIIGVWQEYRAEAALDALKRLSSPRARVLRDGEVRVIDATEVVVGDVLVIETGDRVAADARLVTETDLRIDESALTGESEPVEKELAELLGGHRARRPHVCRLLVDARRGGTGDRARDRDRHGHGRGRDRRRSEGDRSAGDAASEASGEAFHAARRPVCRRGRDHLRLGRAARRGRRRHAAVRRGRGGLGDSGGAAHRGERLARARRAAHGEAQGAREAARGGRDAGRLHGRVYRQDRYAHAQRDDSHATVGGRRALRRDRRRLLARGRDRARSRPDRGGLVRRRAAARGGVHRQQRAARGGRGRPVEHRGQSRPTARCSSPRRRAASSREGRAATPPGSTRSRSRARSSTWRPSTRAREALAGCTSRARPIACLATATGMLLDGEVVELTEELREAVRQAQADFAADALRVIAAAYREMPPEHRRGGPRGCRARLHLRRPVGADGPAAEPRPRRPSPLPSGRASPSR